MKCVQLVLKLILNFKNMSISNNPYYNSPSYEDTFVFTSGMTIRKLTTYNNLSSYRFNHTAASSYMEVPTHNCFIFENVRSSIYSSMLPFEYDKFQASIGAGVEADIKIENSFFENFNGLPKRIIGSLEIDANNRYLKTLKDIHKNFKYGGITGNLSLPNTIRENILGLLLISDLKFVGYQFPLFSNLTSVYTNQMQDFEKAIKIVNSYLQSNKDMLECQEHLISNNLSEFAKL